MFRLLIEPGKKHGHEPLGLTLRAEFMRARARSFPPGAIGTRFAYELQHIIAQYCSCGLRPCPKPLLHALKTGRRFKGQGVFVTGVVTPEEAQLLLQERQKDECHHEMRRIIKHRSQTLRRLSSILLHQFAPAELRTLLGDMVEYLVELFEESSKDLLSKELLEVMKKNLEFTFLAEAWLNKHKQGNGAVTDSAIFLTRGIPIIWLNDKNEATLLVLDDNQHKTASS